MDKDKKDYTNFTLYWCKEDEISIEDFLYIENLAFIENERTRDKIFVMYHPKGLPKSIISLN